MREKIKRVDDRIDFLEINTLPPKAEFEQKLKTVLSEVQELKVWFKLSLMFVWRLAKNFLFGSELTVHNIEKVPLQQPPLSTHTIVLA